MARALITGSLKLWVRAQWIALMTVRNRTFWLLRSSTPALSPFVSLLFVGVCRSRRLGLFLLERRRS